MMPMNARCMFCRSRVATRQLREVPAIRVCESQACSQRFDFLEKATVKKDDEEEEEDMALEAYVHQNIFTGNAPSELLLHLLYYFRDDPETLAALAGTNTQLQALVVGVGSTEFWATSINPDTALPLNEFEERLVNETDEREIQALRAIKTWRSLRALYGEQHILTMRRLIRDGHVGLAMVAMQQWHHVLHRWCHVIYADIQINTSDDTLSYAILSSSLLLNSREFTHETPVVSRVTLELAAVLHDFRRTPAVSHPLMQGIATGLSHWTAGRWLYDRISSPDYANKLVVLISKSLQVPIDQEEEEEGQEEEGGGGGGDPAYLSWMNWMMNSLAGPCNSNDQLKLLWRYVERLTGAGGGSVAIAADFLRDVKNKLLTAEGLWFCQGSFTAVLPSMVATQIGVRLLQWIVGTGLATKELLLSALSVLGAYNRDQAWTYLEILYTSEAISESEFLRNLFAQMWTGTRPHVYCPFIDGWLLYRGFLPGKVRAAYDPTGAVHAMIQYNPIVQPVVLDRVIPMIAANPVLNREFKWWEVFVVGLRIDNLAFDGSRLALITRMVDVFGPPDSSANWEDLNVLLLTIGASVGEEAAQEPVALWMRIMLPVFREVTPTDYKLLAMIDSALSYGPAVNPNSIFERRREVIGRRLREEL